MGWSPAAFYTSTLFDLGLAIEGWKAQEQDKWQWERYNVRQMIYFISQNLDRNKIKEAEQIFGLPMDDEIKRARHKAMPRAKIIQSNGTIIE